MRRVASVFCTGIVLCTLELPGSGSQAMAQTSVDARWTVDSHGGSPEGLSPSQRPITPVHSSAYGPGFAGEAAWPPEARLSVSAYPANASRAYFSSAFPFPVGSEVSATAIKRPLEALWERDHSALSATEQREVWHETDRFADRLRLTTRGDLRRADGAPLPPTSRDAYALDIDSYDVSFTRGWQAARGLTPSGIEVALIPHAGIALGDAGGSAQAGATLKIGPDSLAPNGSARFGDRARWYIYAAGSGRAVGYNFARTRDGHFARSGMSHDAGAFLGDASLGVAYRRGDLQGSFGVVYRELKAEGLRGGEGFDRDVSEGLVAFQLSISPRR